MGVPNLDIGTIICMTSLFHKKTTHIFLQNVL